MNRIQQELYDYLIEQEKQTGKKTSIWSQLAKIDVPEGDDVCSYDALSLKNLIIQAKPFNVRNVYAIKHAIRTLMEWSIDHGYSNVDKDVAFSTLESISPQAIMYESIDEHGASKRFISETELHDAVNEILRDHINAIHYAPLLLAIYEGIYSDDTLVILNLRYDDIKSNTVRCKPTDGNNYDFAVSTTCATLLKQAALADTYERYSPYIGTYATDNIRGLNGYKDAVFKIVKNGDDSSDDNIMSFRSALYKRIRSICKDYLKRSVSVKDIFLSGLIHRIDLNLQTAGYTLEEAFSFRNRNVEITRIINDELQRCRYDIPKSKIRTAIRGHLDEFK